jgi:excisionase family DNA binding protein
MKSGAKSSGDQSPLTTTYRGASQALQCCERKIWQLVKDHELRAIRIGRSVRIPVAELEAFIARQVVANGEGGAV